MESVLVVSCVWQPCVDDLWMDGGWVLRDRPVSLGRACVHSCDSY